MSTKLSKNFITVNGHRAGIRISAGPWVQGVPADLIKIRCKRGIFPTEIRTGLEVTNNSNSLEDYFEGDSLRLLPGHDLYEAARALV